MVEISMLGGEDAPSEDPDRTDYGDLPYDKLPVPEDTWGPCVATGGVAVVPGDDDLGGEEEWASMEEKITAKYMPGKLAALNEGGASDPEAAKRREAAASAVAQFKGGQDSNSQVYSCANCDGQGKVYSTLNLTDYGSEGMTRVMESCCQECMGMGIINKKDPLAAKARKDASQGGTGSNGADRNKPQETKRLDQDDPPVDMDAILAKAGPCPFASRRKK